MRGIHLSFDFSGGFSDCERIVSRMVSRFRTQSRLTWMALCVLAASAFPAPFSRMANVVLLQPEFVLKDRVPDPHALSSYMAQVQTAVEQTASEIPMHAGVGGFVVVAVKPGRRSKVWLDLKPNMDSALSRRLTLAVQGVPPPVVAQGPVVFALNYGLWGALPSSKTAPTPKEWTDESLHAGRSLEIGDLVDRLWK